MNYEKQIGESLIMYMSNLGLISDSEMTEALKDVASWEELILVAA